MRKLLKHTFVVALALLLAQAMSAAVITVLTTNGANSANGRAPQGSRLYINSVYYLSATEMAAFGADQVTSVGWTWFSASIAGGLPQNTTTTGNLKVYLQGTIDAAYSKGTTFSTVGMTKVIDGTITITNAGTQFSIDIPVGGPGTSVFNTIAGQGLYIAFEYQTTTALALPTGAPTVACNNTVLNSMGTYQSNISNGTIMSLTSFRPETRLGNPLTDYSSVQDVYCLGATPIPFGNPQSLGAKIRNESASAQNFDVTFTVQEKVTATVRYTNTTTHSFLASEVKTVTDAGWSPTIQETDTVIVSVAALAGETVISNNSKGYRHVVGPDTYGYADLSATSGGVGFGTGAGQILNRYTVTGCANVEAVRVYIGDLATIGNTIKGVVCNGTGVQVAESSPYVVAGGDYLTWVTLTMLVPPGFSNSDIYVGVEQTAAVTAYYPVGTQAEATPTRNNAFFSNSVGGGALVGPYTSLGRWMLEGVITPLSSNPTATGPATACVDDMITLEATFTELSPSAVVNWYTDGCGTTLVGTGSTIMIPAVLGATTYYVRAEDACNGHTTDCASVTVTGGATELFYADVDGDTYGDPAGMILSCTGAPVGYVVDGTDCDDTNSAINPAATEICNGLDDNCDGSVDEGVVTAVITAPGGLSACKPDAVLLQTTPIAGYTYQWFKNGVAVVGAINPTYSTNKPAYYQVQVTTPGGCFAVSDPVTVTISLAPNANISAPNGTSLCTTVKLKASYAGDYSWQWLQSGSPIAGETNYLYFPTAAGSYSCEVTNAAGCTRETATLTVTACRDAEEVITTGAMTIYPNPTSSTFTLDVRMDQEFSGDAQVLVMNMVGEQVYAGSALVSGGVINETINLPEHTAGGMYLVKVMSNGATFTAQVMIIE